MIPSASSVASPLAEIDTFCAPDGISTFANFAGIDGAPTSSTTRAPSAKPTTTYSPAATSSTSSAENVKSTLSSAAPAAKPQTNTKPAQTHLFIIPSGWNTEFNR